MANSENTKQIIESLHKLQERQLDVTRLEKQIAATPGEIAALESDTLAQERTLAEAEEALLDEQRSNAKLDGDIQSAQDKLATYNEQILKVKTNEELWAMQKEISFVKDKISDSETQIIESMEALDVKSDDLENAKTRLRELSKENKHKASEFQKQTVKMQKELEGAREVQADLRTEIPDQYIELFERIQNVKDGIAMAEAKDGVCLACHVRIRPQVYMELKSGKAIHQCRNCSRVLYYEDEITIENPAELSS